jgi:hypothetical protein
MKTVYVENVDNDWCAVPLVVHRTRKSDVFGLPVWFRFHVIQASKKYWTKSNPNTYMNMINTAWIVYSSNEEAITDKRNAISITWFCIFILQKDFSVQQNFVRSCVFIDCTGVCGPNKLSHIYWKHYFWTRECRDRHLQLSK